MFFIESSSNFEKIFELLNSVQENLNKLNLIKEDKMFLIKNIELILNHVKISSTNSNRDSLKNEVSPKKNRISFLLNNSQQIIT